MATTANALYYDASLCTACKGCQIACKQWNMNPSPWSEVDTPFTGSFENPPVNDGDTFLHITFDEADGGPNGVKFAFNRESCQHCTVAGCVEACPTGAAYHRNDGSVVIDPDVCIGCKYCISACPFNIPKFSDRMQVTRKCWLCQDRTSVGKEPACVQTCPTEALQYGPRADMLTRAYERVDAIKERYPDAVVYGDKEMGGLHLISVLQYGPEFVGLPKEPQLSINTKLSDLVKPLTGIGVLGMLGLVTASFIGGTKYKRGPEDLVYDPVKKDTVAVADVKKGGDIDG